MSRQKLLDFDFITQSCTCKPDDNDTFRLRVERCIFAYERITYSERLDERRALSLRKLDSREPLDDTRTTRPPREAVALVAGGPPLCPHAGRYKSHVSTASQHLSGMDVSLVPSTCDIGIILGGD